MIRIKYSVFIILLIKVLNVSCEGTSSLTFVIDDTLSMYDDIEQVKDQVDLIMEDAMKEKSSEIKDFVLVSFNDPAVTLVARTNDRKKFKGSVNSLYAHNIINEDCPEVAMEGISQGLQESRLGSYIFVFTDASAKDHFNYKRVIDLCQSRQSRVTFVLTGDCSDLYSDSYLVYYKIATACSGQVFKITKDEVTTMLDSIKHSIRGKSSVLVSQLVPPYEETVIPFFIDDKVQSVMISSAGERVRMHVQIPHRNVDLHQIMWTINNKVILLKNPVPGYYAVKVSGHSTTSVMITGKTDFSFRHGFSITRPESLTDTVSQPIADEENNFLSVEISDPENEVNIELAQILDMNENVIMNLTLKRLYGNFYTTEEFTSPQSMIKIAVLGTIKSNGRYIRRIAKTPVEPKIITKPPIIDKTIKKLEVTGDQYIQLSCKILGGKPTPQISWLFAPIFSSHYFPISETGDKLTVPISGSFQTKKIKCVAANSAGRDEHVTEIWLTSKPKIDINDGKERTIKYGSVLSLSCRATAYPEPKLEWRNENHAVLPAKVEHRQSLIGNMQYIYTSTLTLNDVRESQKYFCHASNSRGSSISDINVTVQSPLHASSDEIKSLEYGNSYTIPCQVSSEHPVKIEWFYTPKGTNKTDTLKPSDKYYVTSLGLNLQIKYMDLELQGKYTCKVSLQSDENVFQSYNVTLVIGDLMAPLMTKSSYPIVVREKSPVNINCKILKGIPKPTITWLFKSIHSNNFYILSHTAEELGIKSVTLDNAGIYKCVAANALGQDEAKTELIVESPARINNVVNKFEAVTGDLVLRIPCNVTGHPKPEVTWTVKGETIKNDEKLSIVEGVLVIKNPNVSDTKEYICTAKNVFGTDTKTFDVVVTDKIDYKYDGIFYILRGETKKMECRVPNTDSDKIKWYKNGEIQHESGSFIEFKNASLFMDGNYTCRVSNTLGSESDTILVDVGFVPKFQINTARVIDWEGKGDMNCIVDSKPFATVEWTYNGKPVDSLRDDFQPDIFGWGEYSCRVRNVHGIVERNFTVTSEACLLNRDVESIKNTPVILSESSTWPEFEAVNEYIKIDSGTSMKLLCPSSFQQFPEKTEIDVTCNHQDSYLYGGKHFNYPDFHCKTRVTPVIKKTGSNCLSENAETIRVGFNGNKFVEAYEVCFDNNNNVPLYTYVNITEARYSTKNSHEWNKYPDIGLGNQDTVYTCMNDKSCCFSKEQMVDANDTLFGPVQDSTYVEYLNSVPVWRPCTHRTTWTQIADAIRDRLDIDPKLYVWSGASKYALQNGGKIPRYLWKVVKADDTTIAVVYVNDPTPKSDDILCKNICNGEGLLGLTPKDEFTYCCELDDFATAFEIPKSIFK